jgi:hypothetical protein
MGPVRNALKYAFYCIFAIGCASFLGCVGQHVGQLDSWEERVVLEKRSSEAIKKFIKTYQGGRFTCISTGSFCLPDKAIFQVWVTAKTQETIQSGRALAVTFIKDYLNEMQNNRDTATWYACERENWPSRYSGKLSPKYIGVRIAFWDENVERPKAPYLAEIDFYEDKFLYYEADPKTQALKLVHEETYEEAYNL